MTRRSPIDIEQRDVPVTDRKFRREDEHLVAKDKRDVALSPHGDPLEPGKRHQKKGRGTKK